MVVVVWGGGCRRPELHLLAEGQVVSSLHHHLNQLAQFGFDLDGVDHVSQDAHVPEREEEVGWRVG